jgi:hypothetical protein
MRVLISLTLYFTSLSVISSDFNGKWTGEAVISTLRTETPCNDFNLKLNQTSQELTVSIHYKCPSQRTLDPYSKYTIIGNQLLLNNVSVGKITADGYTIEKKSGRYYLWISKTQTGIFYRELLASRYNFIMIEANLTPSNHKHYNEGT